MPLPKLWQKKMKSHTITKSAILPACCKIVNIMFGEEYEKEILKIPMPDSTVSRHMQDMSQDVESHYREADFFAVQLNKSSDNTGKAQLL
jgi:hypothetical protein